MQNTKTHDKGSIVLIVTLIIMAVISAAAAVKITAAVRTQAERRVLDEYYAEPFEVADETTAVSLAEIIYEAYFGDDMDAQSFACEYLPETNEWYITTSARENTWLKINKDTAEVTVEGF